MNNGQKTLESMNQAIWYNQWTMKKFLPYLKGEILEVGCGIGNFTTFLTGYGRVWAIDINKDYLASTKQVINGKGKVGIGDIEKGEFFFGDRKFNCIVCINVLEHIRDDISALNNLFKLLKKGGILILIVPSHQFLYGQIDKSIGHFRRYKKAELVNKLRELRFEIIESKKLNFLGALGWFIVGKILKENIVKEKNVKIFSLIAPLALSLENLIEPPIGTSILIIAQK